MEILVAKAGVLIMAAPNADYRTPEREVRISNFEVEAGTPDYPHRYSVAYGRRVTVAQIREHDRRRAE